MSLENIKKITVTQGLSELKTLQSRIEKATSELTPVGLSIGTEGVINGYKSNEEFTELTKSKWQSLQDLIKNRDNIKAAIVASNAITKVAIGSELLTVASAIERKNTITFKKDLLSRLKGTYRTVLQQQEKQEKLLNDRYSETVNSTGLGEGEVAENFKKAQLELLVQLNKPKLHDPLDIKAQIEKLENEITDFETNIDYALSVSNATTYIEI